MLRRRKDKLEDVSQDAFPATAATSSSATYIAIIIALSLIIAALAIGLSIPLYNATNPPINNTQRNTPWTYIRGSLKVYRFNVFLLDEDVDFGMVQEMCAAQVQDTLINYGVDWGCVADINVYNASQFSNPALFAGDRIPIIVAPIDCNGCGGFHSVQPTPASQSTFIYDGQSIYNTLGLTVPVNFPYGTPYMFVSTIAANETFPPSNPYAFPAGDFFGPLSATFSHELHEILSNEVLLNNVFFETPAPTVDNWAFGMFNETSCTNCFVGPDNYTYAPTWSSVWTDYQFFWAERETSDPVSMGEFALLQSYTVNGWSMCNYVLPSFWAAYNNLTVGQQYDHLGYVTLPMQPFAGIHELIFMYDMGSALLYPLSVINFGNSTAEERGYPTSENFPPDYTVAYFAYGYGPSELQGYGPFSPSKKKRDTIFSMPTGIFRGKPMEKFAFKGSPSLGGIGPVVEEYLAHLVLTTSETISVTPSETSNVPPSETISVTPSGPPSETISVTPSGPPSETISVTPSGTSSVPTSETISVTPSGTSNGPPSETMSGTTRGTSRVPDHTTQRPRNKRRRV